LSREPRFFDRIFRILVEAKGGVGFAAEGAEIREGEQPCAHRATKGTEEQPVPATDLPRGRAWFHGLYGFSAGGKGGGRHRRRQGLTGSAERRTRFVCGLRQTRPAPCACGAAPFPDLFRVIRVFRSWLGCFLCGSAAWREFRLFSLCFFVPSVVKVILCCEHGVGKMTREFNVVIEKDADGYFVASVPALRGCHTQAKSLDVLMKRIKEAIELCLEVEKPVSNQFVGVQRVAVMA